MRFIKIIPVIVLMALIISCSSDDGPAPNNEIELASGTYSLTELNINPPQDINGDENTTSNAKTELPCATGTLTLKSDATWSWTFVNIDVTAITGGLFNLSCASTNTSRAGTWQASSGQVTLFDGANNYIFARNSALLTLSFNDDLPGFRSWVYEKQ